MSDRQKETGINANQEGADKAKLTERTDLSQLTPTAATFAAVGMVPYDYYQTTSAQSPYHGMTPTAAAELAKGHQRNTSLTSNTASNPSSIFSPYPGDLHSPDPRNPATWITSTAPLSNGEPRCKTLGLDNYHFVDSGFTVNPNASSIQAGPLTRPPRCVCQGDAGCMSTRLTGLLHQVGKSHDGEGERERQGEGEGEDQGQDSGYRVTVVDGACPWLLLDTDRSRRCATIEAILNAALTQKIATVEGQAGITDSDSAWEALKTACSDHQTVEALKRLSDSLRMPLQIMRWIQPEASDEPQATDKVVEYISHLSKQRMGEERRRAEVEELQAMMALTTVSEPQQ